MSGSADPLVFVVDKATGDRFLLPEVKIESVVEELNGAGEATISFDPNSENATEVKLGERELELWEGDDIVYAGVLADLTGNSERLTVKSDGLFDYFRTRFVLDTDLVYTNQEQLSIASALVVYAQSAAQGTNPDLNIDIAGFDASGILRDRTYIADRTHDLLTALAEFATLEEGFDQAIVPQNDGTRLWTPYFPRRGELKDDDPLEYGREIKDYTYKESYRKRATSITATGGVAEQVDGNRIKQAFTYEDTAASAKYGVSIAVLPSGSRSDLEWLEARARSAVSVRRSPVKVPDIIVDNAQYPIRGLVGVGDTVPVRIDHGRVQVAGDYRVQRTEWNPDDDTLKLTFLEPDDV